MSVQDDKGAGHDDDQRLTEKPEPDEDDKKQAARMMEAYDDDRATIVLPGTGGSVSGTAVNEWLDEEGNPRDERPEGADAAAQGDDARDEHALREQIEKDKNLNERLKEAAVAPNKGENR